ncbi:MAG: hypothetical protein JOZ34_00765 [Gammaproteobacteria bacterium]|nr:hypothetical protein [Gammaproteobacteria bacterium]
MNVGASTTLTWAAYNVTSCNASGSWSGAQKAAGSLTITPTAAGTQTYTLSCTNPHGSSQKSASLTVQAASAGGGGGGGLDALTLLALIVLGTGIQVRRVRALSMHS